MYTMILTSLNLIIKVQLIRLMTIIWGLINNFIIGLIKIVMISMLGFNLSEFKISLLIIWPIPKMAFYKEKSVVPHLFNGPTYGHITERWT